MCPFFPLITSPLTLPYVVHSLPLKPPLSHPIHTRYFFSLSPETNSHTYGDAEWRWLNMQSLFIGGSITHWLLVSYKLDINDTVKWSLRRVFHLIMNDGVPAPYVYRVILSICLFFSNTAALWRNQRFSQGKTKTKVTKICCRQVEAARTTLRQLSTISPASHTITHWRTP